MIISTISTEIRDSNARELACGKAIASNNHFDSLFLHFLFLRCYSFICANKLQAEYDILSNWNNKIQSEIKQTCTNSLMIKFIKGTFELLNIPSK